MDTQTLPTGTLPTTLETLKQQARTRKEQREANELNRLDAELAANAARQTSLLEFIRSTAPFSALASNARMTTADDRENGVIVTFEIDGYADIASRFVWSAIWNAEAGRHFDGWQDRPFQSFGGMGGYNHFREDPSKVWRVRSFKRIEWESESDEYYPQYNENYFIDLGDALLHAEETYVDREQIRNQVTRANATKAFTSPVAPSEPVHEPTVEENLIAALKAFISEYMAPFGSFEA